MFHDLPNFDSEKLGVANCIANGSWPAENCLRVPNRNLEATEIYFTKVPNIERLVVLDRPQSLRYYTSKTAERPAYDYSSVPESQTDSLVHDEFQLPPRSCRTRTQDMAYSVHQSSPPSFAPGLSGNDVIKRKALAYLFGQASQDVWQNNSQKSGGFSQKKPKLVQQYQCYWKGCQASFEIERDRRLHMRVHARKSRDSDSSESTGCSADGLDLSSGNSAESNFDSDSSELSSLSTATSRSSCTPNCETVSTDMQPHNFSPPINGPQVGANHHIPTANMQQGSLRIFATPRFPPEQRVATSPIRSTTKKCGVRQLNTYESNQTDSQSCGGSTFGRDGVENEQSQFPSSGMSSGRSQPTAPSVAGTDNPSENGTSSQSQTSSTVSDSSEGEKDEDETHSETKLENLVKNHVLRTDPEVADLFLRAVDGQLEVASGDNIEQLDDLSGLSLLHLLELPRSGSTQDFAGLTSHAQSSSSGSSSSSSSNPDQGPGASSPSNGQLGSSGGVPMNRGSSGPGEGPSQRLKGQKTSAKSGSSQGAKTQPLRCIHNALIPEVFCVNHETHERFRACAGPGWSSIQHYKEHMQSHHTKKVKKASSLQCSDCQSKFQNQDELKSHKLDVDCPIRCPDCSETFDAKAKRTDHQKERHPEAETDVALLEIDENMWKRIKDNLKAYLDVVKKGLKGKDPSNPSLDGWVDANTPRYMIGRSSKTNPKLELGQWYTIFKTLAPSAEIIEHPFYEYPVPGMPPRSDFIEERIIFINDNLVESRIQAHGPPPTDLQLQRDWYRGILRESLQVAAHTVYHPRKRTASPEVQANQSWPIQRPSERVVQAQGYNMPNVTTTHQDQMGYLQNVSSGMSFQQEPFVPNNQQEPQIGTGLPNEMHGGEPMNQDIFNSWIYTQPDIANGPAPPLNSQYNIEFAQDMRMEFSQQDLDLLANPTFPSGCPGPQGQPRRRKQN